MNDERSALAARRPGERACPRCGTLFVCGNEAGAPSCWCAELPPLLSLPTDGSGCYCPACLRAIIAQQGELGNQAGRKS